MKKERDFRFAAMRAVIIALFGVLAYLFPYSGDDWAWGSQFGLDRLSTWFEGYNGRYAGNLLVMLITRSFPLKILCMALSYYLVVYIAYKYAGAEHSTVLLFATALFYAIPKEIFVQAVAWAAGYSNYVPPILIMMAYIVVIRNIFCSEVPRYTLLLIPVTFLMGFVAALFMENLTLYSVALSALVILYCLVRFKKIFAVHIAYSLGAITGGFYMFTNSVYGLIANGNDPRYYRSVPNENNLQQTILTNLKTIFEQLFTKNIIILVVLSILAALLCVIKLGNTRNNKARTAILVSLFVNFLTLPILKYKSQFTSWGFFVHDKPIGNWSILIFALIAVLYYVSLLVMTAISLSTNGSSRDKAIFIGISIPIMVAPLVLVNPIGPRCFFPPVMLMIMLATLCFNEILECKKDIPYGKNVLTLCCAAAITAGAFHYISIYLPVHGFDRARTEQAIRDSKTSNTITVCNLPNASYVWNGSVAYEPCKSMFKLFYGIDEDVEFTIVEYYNYKVDK